MRCLSNLAVFVLATLGAFGFVACDDKKETPASAPGKLKLEFQNVAGSQPLTLGATYTTAAGDQFTASLFNYYISSIRLRKADGSEWVEPESYHLVRQSAPDSRLLELKEVPPGDYTGLTFTIGVDSTRNVSGSQTGALDPLNGMFWSWSSGYVFLKLEGTSPQSGTGRLVYHVGGFRRPHNTIRTVSPALPTGSVLRVKAGSAPTVMLRADVLKMFSGPHAIRFAQLANTGHSSDANSMKLADNYAAGMFRVHHVLHGQ
jgi:hypothetical protein